MKKFIYLFIATACLSSCESNEDDDSPSTDPIIGIWQLTSEAENGTDISTSCERKSTVTFLENGTFNSTSFYDDGNGCMSESDGAANWENTGQSNYLLDFEDNDTSTTKITFSENNTVFSVTDIDDYNGTTITYISTFKKL